MSFAVRLEWCKTEAARLMSTGKASQAAVEQVQSPDPGTCLAWSVDRRKARVAAVWQGQGRERGSEDRDVARSQFSPGHEHWCYQLQWEATRRFLSSRVREANPCFKKRDHLGFSLGIRQQPCQESGVLSKEVKRQVMKIGRQSG